MTRAARRRLARSCCSLSFPIRGMSCGRERSKGLFLQHPGMRGVATDHHVVDEAGPGHVLDRHDDAGAVGMVEATPASSNVLSAAEKSPTSTQL